MKKVLCALSIMSILCATVAAANNDILERLYEYNIKIGMKQAHFSDGVYIKNDKIYVPLRELCDNLNIPIEYDSTNKQVFLNIYKRSSEHYMNTNKKEDGIITDEETAVAVGKIILEKYSGKETEYETEDAIYYLKAKYSETDNAWLVYQDVKFKGTKGWSVEGAYPMYVGISRCNGEILTIRY